MTSKEALEVLLGYASFNERYYFHKGQDPYGIILKDLERLEQLEDNIKIHKETIKMQHNQIESLEEQNKGLKEIIEIDRKIDNKLLEIVEESLKLKKVIEILKRYLKLKVETFINLDKTTTYGLNYDTYCITIDYEVYDLLKEAFENDK